MYSELRKHLQANFVKRANSAYEDYNAKGVYDLPPGQIPNEALLARNEYRLAQQANNTQLPETTRANMASGGVNYTGQSWGESLADYGNRYADGWRRGLGFESHYGDDPYLDAAGWANNIALSTIPIGGAVGAVGRAGLTAARLAGRAAPMAARAVSAARNAASLGRYGIDMGLYGGAKAVQGLGRFAQTGYNYARNPAAWAQTAGNAVRAAPRMALEGAVDFAAPGARLLTQGLRGNSLGSNAMRLLGAGMGGYSLYENIDNTVRDYSATGNLQDALINGVYNHAARIPVSPVGNVGTAFATAGPLASQFFDESAASSLIEEQKNKGMVGLSGLTPIEEGLNSKNPAERQVAIDAVRAKVQELHPFGQTIANVANKALNLNPLEENYKDLRDHNMTLNATAAVDTAIRSGQGSVSVIASSNKAMQERGMDPAEYPFAPLNFYKRYLEAEIAKGQNDEYAIANTYKVLTAAQELQRLNAAREGITDSKAMQQFLDQSMMRLNSTLSSNMVESQSNNPVPSSSLMPSHTLQNKPAI